MTDFQNRLINEIRNYFGIWIGTTIQLFNRFKLSQCNYWCFSLILDDVCGPIHFLYVMASLFVIVRILFFAVFIHLKMEKSFSATPCLV